MVRALWTLVLVAGLLSPAPASARPGQLDRGFDGDGRQQLPVTQAGAFVDVAVAPNGATSVLTLEQAEPEEYIGRDGPSLPPPPTWAFSYVSRFGGSGRLDRRYGDAGVLAVPRLSRTSGLTVDRQGRTLIWGPSGLLRLKGSGVADPTFGNRGSFGFPANWSLVGRPARGGGRVGVVLAATDGRSHMAIDLSDDGRAPIEDRSFAAALVAFPDASVVGPPGRLTVVQNDLVSDRTVLAGRNSTAEVPWRFRSAVGIGGDPVGVHARSVGDGRHYLERLSTSGGLRWRLPLTGRLGGIPDDAAMVADGRGGLYVAAVRSPWSLSLVVFHVTGTGRIDRGFGDDGVRSLPTGPNVTKVALALGRHGSRLAVAHQEPQPRTPGSATTTIVALRTR